jgi:uncharacterized protein (UPF0210 family)
MTKNYSIKLCVALIALIAFTLTPSARSANKPVIRAITAFTVIDPNHIDASLHDAVAMLTTAKASYEKAGYTVQTMRITMQPFQIVVQNMTHQQAIEFFNKYSVAAEKAGVITAIGFPWSGNLDHAWTETFAEVLAAHSSLDGCVIVAESDGHILWPAIREAAFVMKYLENHTQHGQGNFGFAAAAAVPWNSPFFPASYTLVPLNRFAIAIQGAGFVGEAFTDTNGDFDVARHKLTAVLRRDLPEIQELAEQVEQSTRWEYMGLDASTAPLQNVSIGGAIEKLTGNPIGSPGTMSAAAVVTGALKGDPMEVKRVGYNGLMLPVLEDKVLAQRWSEGRLTLDSLLAYSSVCGTGLDTVPLPGDVSEDQLVRIIGDVASLAVKWNKPLTARLFPVPGKKAGDRTEFDSPYLVNATIQKLPQ